ncbi:carboxylesterase [Apiospora phragmitis]|uniref:Carboxylic ester hydrolase n=1 Tax=Apiospora phragmitis TaxID=2905665 RepID=A0ABR1VZ23_9PEZI
MLFKGFSALLPFLASVAAANPVSKPMKQPCSSDLKVQLRDGVVHGLVDSTTPGVRQFLGIPYAQPPLGDLRFAPPQPLAKPFGEFNATKPPVSCMQYATKIPNIYNQLVPQYLPYGLVGSPGPISEDCLTISVWAPRGTQKKNLPVLLFIFGGSFQYGAEEIPYLIPAEWVQRTQDHLVVSFNYRLNIFGYPNAAGLPTEEENPGLLDQRFAVEWVRDNIAAFGGDTKRIGLWGQSAGAISVGTYGYAYPEDPIVNTLLMDSGSEFYPAPVLYATTSDVTHSNFTFVASKFGCGGLNPAAELACMRKADAFAIENFLEVYQDSFTQPLIAFAPTVDGKTFFADYNARALAGKIAKIPTLIGSNAQDGSAFMPFSINGVNATVADAVTFNYFFCPAYKSAADRLAAGIPVYRYLYSGNFTNISPKPWLGAYHESELPLLMGTHPLFRGNSTEFEYQTSDLMQDSWLTFVATAGDAAAMSSKVGWPEWTNADSGLVRSFAPAPGVTASSLSLHDLEKLCPAGLQPN